ncbi:hypothetical protein Xcel_2503 [Xylanimonas cellulosilytica DSM 15894]|uniref:LysM domain-containing protein n=1 Tax=Xylanimonas cellulosilytica (strain DSM 15894 / JCM 12276 / CECT 5975 / KCTC 9989 / LMG 20990 / NBRC 107835 / XIL07) TaxID=446471 RepID=D1BWH3_XYLCX|nr:LysM domain-containing protein [Xylanimonas cellulosilytica]ACZ31518.1 hypothetical protein Xcel_2503 [Xylanimonas cellulosilytica DSM 15894]
MERRSPRGTAARLLALGAGLGAATVALTARAVVVAATLGPPATGMEAWVEVVVVGGAALAAAWVAFGAFLGLAVVTAAGAGMRWRAGEAAVRMVAPVLVQKLVRAGIGVGVGTGLALTPTAALAAPTSAVVSVAAGAGSVIATEAGSAEGAAAAGGISTGVDLSWTPTATAPSTAGPRPVTSQAAAPAEVAPSEAPVEAASAEPALAAAPPADEPPVRSETVSRTVRSTPPDGTVVVLRGDTLWGIAARWLGGDPTDAEVMAATVRWHEANRDVIGDDADVILPGQILSPPA